MTIGSEASTSIEPILKDGSSRSVKGEKMNSGEMAEWSTKRTAGELGRMARSAESSERNAIARQTYERSEYARRVRSGATNQSLSPLIAEARIR